MTEYYKPETHTPEEWEEKAQACLQRSAESFERSDTDGFLSQWANDSTAVIYRSCAVLARAGGKWEVNVLEDLDGNEVKAKIINTRFGTKWGVLDGNDQVIKWLTFKPARESTLSKHGYKESTRVKDCVVKVEYSASNYQPIINYVARISPIQQEEK